MPVVIVGIDEPAFSELGLQWPWPRGRHAELIRQLSQGEASVIAFGILFADPSLDAGDAALETAIKDSENVILASDIVLQNHAQYEQLIQVDPLERFLDAGAEPGISSISLDHDLVVRQVPTNRDAFWRRIYQAYVDNLQSDFRDFPRNSMRALPWASPHAVLRLLLPGAERRRVAAKRHLQKQDCSGRTEYQRLGRTRLQSGG